jgi:hypothetical protein
MVAVIIIQPNGLLDRMPRPEVLKGDDIHTLFVCMIRLSGSREWTALCRDGRGLPDVWLEFASVPGEAESSVMHWSFQCSLTDLPTKAHTSLTSSVDERVGSQPARYQGRQTLGSADVGFQNPPARWKEL